MRQIRKSALAESDLVDIWEYSFEQWDAVQADKYLDELDHGIKQLANNPEMGARRGYVREGYRVLLINSHAVYYTETTSTIYIVRVLHGQMDPRQASVALGEPDRSARRRIGGVICRPGG